MTKICSNSKCTYHINNYNTAINSTNLLSQTTDNIALLIAAAFTIKKVNTYGDKSQLGNFDWRHHKKMWYDNILHYLELNYISLILVFFSIIFSFISVSIII